MLARLTPPRAPVGAMEEVLPCLVEVPQRLLLNDMRPAGKPRLRLPGGSQLRGLFVKPRRGSLPAPPHQALLQTKVPHIPGVSALLQQEHILCNARIQTEPHGPQRGAGLRHPCRNQTPVFGVVAPLSTISMSTWCSSPRTAATRSTLRASTGANTSRRRPARTSGRLLPSNRAGTRGRFWSPSCFAASLRRPTTALHRRSETTRTGKASSLP